MNLLIAAVLIGQLTPTAYRSVPSQTDDTPFHTSIGEHVHPHGVAVSRDLLARWGGPLHYGDMVFVEGVGQKIVNDVMNERHKQRIDIWVNDLEGEKKFHAEFKNKKVRVWLIRAKEPN
jgi:3D (Asp-Asp-Asp) domain-containing protein